MKEVKSRKPLIVLIEDEEVLTEFYNEIFQELGFEIVILNSLGEGLKFLKEIREGKKKSPDLILLDLILGEENGIHILKEARKYPETRDLLIFALTNYTDPHLDKELIKEGIDKILVKTDYGPKELIEIIKKALS